MMAYLITGVLWIAFAFTCALVSTLPWPSATQRAFNRGKRDAMRNARIDARNRAYLCGMRAADKAWRNVESEVRE